jgi:hypothetical protein
MEIGVVARERIRCYSNVLVLFGCEEGKRGEGVVIVQYHLEESK